MELQKAIETRRRQKKAIITVGVILCVLINFCLFGFPPLFRYLLDTSEYSESYSESAFKKVEIGMTEAEVVQLLGQPLGKHEYGMPSKEDAKQPLVMWRYSWSPPDGNYHRRWIGFDADGRVSEKSAYYYWD